MKARVRSEHLPTRELRIVDLKTSPKLSIWPQAHAQVRAYAMADEKCGGGATATPIIVVVDAEGRYAVSDCVCSEQQFEDAFAWYRAVKPINAACESRHRDLRRAA